MFLAERADRYFSLLFFRSFILFELTFLIGMNTLFNTIAYRRKTFQHCRFPILPYALAYLKFLLLQKQITKLS